MADNVPMRSRELPIGKVDKKSRLVCPTCGFQMPIPPDRWMGRGEAKCPNEHWFFVTDDVAMAINEPLSKTREGNWRKDTLKNFEESPQELFGKREGGKIILP